MSLWTYSVRETLRRPGRTLLTLLGIAVGLAVVVATRLTIDSAHRAYRDLSGGVGGRAALEVTAPGLAAFDGEFAPALAALPGVRTVIPRVQGMAAVSAGRGSAPVRVLGIDPACAGPDLPVRAGRPLDGANDALLEADQARALDLEPGMTVHVWAPAGSAELHLAGILEPRGAATTLGGVLVVPLNCARRLFALPGRVTSVEVVLADGADTATVLAAVTRRLPPGLSVQPPGRHGELAGTTLEATEQGLAYLSAVALTAAAFVILNTFLLSLGERRRQLAILRATGATRGQVTRLLLREALLFGMAGTVIGCVAGVALAGTLLRLVGQFLATDLPGLRLTVGPFLLAGLLGPGTAVAAALWPAWRAAHRPLLQELLPRRGRPEDPLPFRVCVAGLLLLVVGGALSVALCRDWLPSSAGQVLLTPTLVLLLAGGVLSLPLLAAPLLRLAASVPLGVAGTLAGQQLGRQRTRTGLTAGVLFLALAVAIGFGHTLRGIVRDLRHWYHRCVVADFIVRGSMPDTSFALATALPEALAGEVAAACAAAGVDRMSFLPGRAGDLPILVLARTFAPTGPLPLDLREGDTEAVRRGLARGEVVVGTALAERLRLHRGDTLTLATPHGPREFRVAGTATEYVAGGLALYLDWDTARQRLDVPGVHVFLVHASPGGRGELAAALKRFCADRHLVLQSNAELGGLIDGLLGRVAGVLWALLALAFVVASLGIVNTLTMNVHDQTREFGVLRALGLNRGQLYRIVVAQAVLVWGVSLLPGVLGGVALAYVINRGTAAWTGPPVAFHLDGLVAAVSCGLALVTALVAALIPARRAARLLTVRALQHS